MLFSEEAALFAFFRSLYYISYEQSAYFWMCDDVIFSFFFNFSSIFFSVLRVLGITVSCQTRLHFMKFSEHNILPYPKEL